MFIQAQGQRHRSTSTRDPTFPQQSQAGVPSVESWLMMTMSRSGAGSFQGFTSFISTPDFINDVGHQPRSYPNLLVSLGIVGFHGDPNFLNKTLKHLPPAFGSRVPSLVGRVSVPEASYFCLSPLCPATFPSSGWVLLTPIPSKAPPSQRPDGRPLCPCQSAVSGALC